MDSHTTARLTDEALIAETPTGVLTIKPIKMNQISAHQVKVFFAKLIASIVIIGGLMGSMAIVELIAGL
jgi:hypothetical protein